MIKKWILVLILTLGGKGLHGQTVNIPEGSVIIDMGVLPQTVENGLKPYGLVYSLITNHTTPVIWSINPSKSKDGADFIVDNREFKGGTFIVSSQFLTEEVLEEIAFWETEGVVTYNTLTEVQVPFYRELKFFPNWVLDTNNGGIAEDYLKNAGIPVEIATREALPTELTTCDDLFILPHADPNWEDHGEALLDWNAPYGSGPNIANGGYIWSGCHAVSALENLYNPSNPVEQTNFLSIKTEVAVNNGDDYYENALSLWGEHNDASGASPFQIDFPTDPFMQFMGSTDGAHAGGSEQIYLPVMNGDWRNSTQIGVWDANHEDLGTISNGKAALIAFGYAFGDANRGQVMYQGGHQLTNGSEEENVAAQRTFLNFSFEAAKLKVPSVAVNSSVPTIIEGSENIQFDVTGSTYNGNGITYEWTSSNPLGTFDDNTSATPVFMTSEVTYPQLCVVTVKATDACGRVTFNSWGIKIIPLPAPPVARNDNYGTYNTLNVSFNVLDNDTDLNSNLDPQSFSPLSPLEVDGGVFVNNGEGNLTFIPEEGFSGVARLDYEICDTTAAEDGGPFCETATITVQIASSTCSSSETIRSETSYAYEVVDSNKWKNEDKSLGIPDSDYSKSDDSVEGYVIYDLGGNAYIGSQITIRIVSDQGDQVNGIIDISDSATNFPNLPMPVSTSVEEPVFDEVIINVTKAGLRYVKIEGDKDLGIESILFIEEVCTVPPAQIAVPTVNKLITENTAPTISGTWGGDSNGEDRLIVTVNGESYDENNGLVIDNTLWSLTMSGADLSYGSYEIEAVVIRSSTGEEIKDISDNELFITPSGGSEEASVTSGNDGGLESNGDLASLIAKRNFKRKKEGNSHNTRDLQTVYVKDLNMRKNTNFFSKSLEDHLPESGFNKTEVAYVSSPVDLLNITNAKQVFSADYYEGERRVAAALVTETKGTIYDHSKIICDRLNSSSLENAWIFSVRGYDIVSSELLRDNGAIEYTLSFSVRLGDKSNELFSYWNISEYPEGDYYNFQIWGSSYPQLLSICNEVLASLSSEKALVATKSDNQIPSVFVSSGYYTNGEVHLNIINKSSIKAITFNGEFKETEVSERSNMSATIELTGAYSEEIVIRTGPLFDIGFSISSSDSTQKDALYLADGPWGLDYLSEYASVDEFMVGNDISEGVEDLYEVERQPAISGYVKGNINLFRHLLPGDQTLDVTDFDFVQFHIQNDQPVEIILMPEDLEDWDNRLRYTIKSGSEEKFYRIPFDDFKDADGKSAELSNIKTVVFSIIGDYETYVPFRLNINGLAFGNNGTIPETTEANTNVAKLVNYPNPFKTNTTILLPSIVSYVDIQVYDLLGRTVDSQHIKANSNKVSYEGPGLIDGIYKYVLIDSNNKRYTGTFLIE